MSNLFLEQRINIKFYVKLGNNASDTCAMLSEAYGREAMKKSSVLECHKRFKEGRENVKVDERSSRPRCHRTDKNVEKLRNLMHSDNILSISQSYYVEILKRLREAVCRKGPNFGTATGLSIVTVLFLTRRSLSSSF
jgi:hypothetical protein